MAALRGAHWPAAADPRAADRLAERLPDAPWRRTPAGIGLVAALGGNAPYLADLAIREPEALAILAADGPGAVVAAAMADLANHGFVASPAAAARRAKRQVALAVAVADIGGLWRLDQVTSALSDLADLALALSVDHALSRAHAAGRLCLPDPADPSRGCGFVVLAMGKLGGRELNYSSDVDLVMLHDTWPGLVATDAASATFTRIARDIVALMEARDADGYVFRTDLRLRPDPAATPPSVNLTAALSYYEAMAQSWERAAMLKARPVAGDIAIGEAFRVAIRPFVWRRGLDFALVADLQAMKRRIDAHKRTGLAANGDPATRALGHDVKLGEGGIREVEFLAQTLQLVWGGREPGLRSPRTVTALRALNRAGHLATRSAGELIAAYRFLRRVEHRLQMVADRQTHRLPDTAAGLAAFATFMGFADADRFATVLLRHLRRVGDAGRTAFGAVPVSGGDLDVPPLGPMPTDLLGRVSAMGFADPDVVLDIVRGWQAGRLRALRSGRARELLGDVLPALLGAIGRQEEPDAAWARLDRFVARLPAGVQLLSLFARNPALIERIATVLGAAPALAEHLATSPAALDGLLAGDVAIPDMPATLARQLAGVVALEEVIGLVRRFVREEDFAISVATLEERIDVDAAGSRRAALADAAIGALLPFVADDVVRRHGTVRGGAWAIVLLGKAGSREMMAGSDLDLMMVYDHPPDVAASVGGRPVAPAQWYFRATQALVGALTAPDAGGALYAVDMRLRPSGNKGPVAVSRAALRAYHAPGGGAWTWERMALTRARVVAGDAVLVAVLERDIAAVLVGGNPARIRADVLAMRARLAETATPTPGPFGDARRRSGGLVDVEFIAQGLRLMHNVGGDNLQATRDALSRLAGPLDPAEVVELVRADRVWRTVIGLSRLVGGAPGLARIAAAARAAGLDSWGLDKATEPGLHGALDSMAATVRAIFVRVLGEPGQETTP